MDHHDYNQKGAQVSGKNQVINRRDHKSIFPFSAKRKKVSRSDDG